jgi:hypothetical protein
MAISGLSVFVLTLVQAPASRIAQAQAAQRGMLGSNV